MNVMLLFFCRNQKFQILFIYELIVTCWCNTQHALLLVGKCNLCNSATISRVPLCEFKAKITVMSIWGLIKSVKYPTSRKYAGLRRVIAFHAFHSFFCCQNVTEEVTDKLESSSCFNFFLLSFRIIVCPSCFLNTHF